MKKKTVPGLKIICLNRKARFNYFFNEVLEAGIVLKGSEVKSIHQMADQIDRFPPGTFWELSEPKKFEKYYQALR